MNNTKLIVMASVVLVCMAVVPAAARIPFEISGYVHFASGSACLNPAVTITNLNTGKVMPVMTLPSSNYYQAKPAPLLDEISENDVLELRASAGTESIVMKHRILASDLNSGALYLNITLGTAGTATESEAGDPPLPQAQAVSTPDTTATITDGSTSTAASPPAPSQEKQTPGFEIVSASAAMVACLIWARRRDRIQLTVSNTNRRR